MGHLLQQNDNQRLARRGHGLDLSTLGHGALRAASGLHLSTQARAQGSAGSTQLSEARAPLAQLEQAMGLSQALSDSAQKHNAKLSDEAAPEQLPEQRGRQALIDSQRQTDQRGGAAPEGLEPGSVVSTHGGAGSVAAPRRPDILVHGDGGVFAATPGHSVWSAGNTLGFTAYQDLNASSARHTSVAVKSGISLFTVGQATHAHKPTQETGMALHAASGSVSVQAQSSTLGLTADQSITLASTTASLTVGAPKHLLLTAGGSAIRLSNGSITLTTPGPVAFQAAMRELAGGAKAGTSLSLPKTQPLKGCAVKMSAATARGSAFVPR
jgi:type VI secretion system secreted protein VgrG